MVGQIVYFLTAFILFGDIFHPKANDENTESDFFTLEAILHPQLQHWLSAQAALLNLRDSAAAANTARTSSAVTKRSGDGKKHCKPTVMH